MLNTKPALTLLTSLTLTACQLTVAITGNGAGAVSTAEDNIQCSNTDSRCETHLPINTNITLTATPAANSRFVEWSGACSGTTETCTLTLSANRDVFARFESLLPADLACGTPAAKAGCQRPTQSDAYYIEQSIQYFRTMESSVDIRVQPNYSLMVARWEWQPWLMLTGLGNANLILTDLLLKLHPTRYSSMDCRAFPTQPFGRCHVVFDYSGQPCPIYEEFSFNEAGEMTFIEAWSDYPTLVPMRNPDDYWGEGEDVTRLGTRIPGLGTPTGLIAPFGADMRQAASTDADVADFMRRAQKPYSAYFKELAGHLQTVAEGCKPPRA